MGRRAAIIGDPLMKKDLAVSSSVNPPVLLSLAAIMTLGLAMQMFAVYPGATTAEAPDEERSEREVDERDDRAQGPEDGRSEETNPAAPTAPPPNDTCAGTIPLQL